jgi:hypothetical protein
MERREEAFLLGGRADLADQIHIAFVRRGRVQRYRSQGRQTGFSQHQRRFHLRQVTAVVKHMRCHQARGARMRAQFLHQRRLRAVGVQPRIALVRNDHLMDELLDTRRQGDAAFTGLVIGGGVH